MLLFYLEKKNYSLLNSLPSFGYTFSSALGISTENNLIHIENVYPLHRSYVKQALAEKLQHSEQSWDHTSGTSVMSGTSRQKQLKAALKHLQATEDII